MSRKYTNKKETLQYVTSNRIPEQSYGVAWRKTHQTVRPRLRAANIEACVRFLISREMDFFQYVLPSGTSSGSTRRSVGHSMRFLL